MIDKVIKIVEDARKKIIDNYDSMGLRASGKFADELEVIQSEGHVKLVAAAHSWYMENGRAAGKAPPREVIIQWIHDKQIQFSGISENSLAYLICRKIGREGIAVPNPYNEGGVISNILDDEFRKEISDQLVGICREIVINNLKK